MKCKQPHPGFELLSPCPFPMIVTITSQAGLSMYGFALKIVYQFMMAGIVLLSQEDRSIS